MSAERSPDQGVSLILFFAFCVRRETKEFCNGWMANPSQAMFFHSASTRLRFLSALRFSTPTTWTACNALDGHVGHCHYDGLHSHISHDLGTIPSRVNSGSP